MIWRPNTEQVLEISRVKTSPRLLIWLAQDPAILPKQLWYLQRDRVSGRCRTVQPVLSQQIATGTELSKGERAGNVGSLEEIGVVADLAAEATMISRSSLIVLQHTPTFLNCITMFIKLFTLFESCESDACASKARIDALDRKAR